MEKANWADRVLGRLNLSEKGQVALFGDLAVKNYEKGIKNKKSTIEKLKSELAEKLEEEEQILVELKEDLLSITESVNVEQIKSVDARKTYFDIFDKNISSAMSKTDAQEKYIVAVKESVDKQIKNLESEIKILETKLSYLK